ncbi:MAG TPA: shikimate dehydrogenase [Candidatus Limnocylindria bacterium]|nr:shikimate dehydrogenase [Candidatus Limnocylindria bacterium]
MQRLPIIGLSQDASPLEAVLRAGLAAAGADVELERAPTRPHQLPDAIAALRAADVLGALVAAPHKEKAATLLDALSDDARASGAVNIVVRDGAKLRGYNSDLDGIRTGLAAILPKVQGKWPRSAIVLGAGGGARAAVAVLIQSGMQRVTVFNRHLHKAEALVTHLGRSARHMELRARPWHDAILEAELTKAPLLVNASGLGDRDGSPVPQELLPEGMWVLDLVLHGGATPLMRAAKERGGTVANGQAAFLAGAAEALRRLTGSAGAADVLREALAAELGVSATEVAIVGD